MAKHVLKITFDKMDVGRLIYDDSGGRYSIKYSEQWKKEGFAISPHIPLDKNASPFAVDRYLKNLLPEGTGLETLSVHTSVSKGNTFSLIRKIGLDVSGAMMFGEPEHSDEAIFTEVTEERLQSRIDEEGLDAIAVWDGKVRLSVAGVQSKLAVYIDDEGRMGFGDGRLASTHILKFEKRLGSNLVLNELYCMRLARNAKLNVADVELRRYGVHNAILVKRFDRYIVDDSVKRIHVIDGCQLVNLPPEHKYERNYGSAEAVRHMRDGVSFEKLFGAVDEKMFGSSVQARLVMIDWAIFTLLISNADAHGKNISFLLDKKGIKPAPFYDMLCVAMHTKIDSPSGEQKVDHDLAMAFGDDFAIEEVSGFSLVEFSEAVGEKRKLVAQRALDVCKRVENALPLELDEALSKTETVFIAKLKTLIHRRIDEVRDAAEYARNYRE